MNAKKLLSKDSSDEVSRLFKSMLVMVEDMKKDHDFHYEKLYENIPKEYHKIINTANHFTPQKVNWIRKRILDIGNESIRNLDSNIDNYAVSFTFK
jgi:glucan phosphorylase|tara:strand:- start:3587 stop:3874 length:288 start_codon:yes stop_codon:yes gene_type:complete